MVKKMQRKQLTFKQYGFIILTIVVTSVFFAFASVSYCDYTDRVRAAEGLMLVSGAKTAIVEYYDKHQVFPPDNAAAGLAAPNEIIGNAVSSVEVSSSGIGSETKSIITITYNKKLHKDQTIVISATPPKNGEGFVWDCTGGTLSDVFRSPECRDSSKTHLKSERLTGSAGVLVFILCFLLVKIGSFLFINNYSVFKFFLEVIVAVTLFQIIDYVYIIYFSSFHLEAFFHVQVFIYFLLGLILNLIVEPIYAKLVNNKSKKEDM